MNAADVALTLTPSEGPDAGKPIALAVESFTYSVLRLGEWFIDADGIRSSLARVIDTGMTLTFPAGTSVAGEVYLPSAAVPYCRKCAARAAGRRSPTRAHHRKCEERGRCHQRRRRMREVVRELAPRGPFVEASNREVRRLFEDLHEFGRREMDRALSLGLYRAPIHLTGPELRGASLYRAEVERCVRQLEQDLLGDRLDGI